MALSGLDCHACKDKAGCEEEAEYPIYDLDGEPLYRCPVRLVTPETADILEIHAMCKAASGLPFPGAVLQQPARIMEAFRLIEGTVNLWQKKHAPKPRPR